MGALGSVALALGLVAMIALQKLLLLFVRFVWYCGMIWSERNLLRKIGYKLKFPRDQSEIWANNGRDFVRFCKDNNLIPSNASDVSSELLAGIDTEPDKDATSVSVRVTYTADGGKGCVKDLFLKFQTGTGMPLWLQALRAAAEPGVAREVDFYNKLAQDIPMLTPSALYARKAPEFNLVCIALEHLKINKPDGDNGTEGETLRVIPDHKFCYAEDSRLLLSQVAGMHGMFLSKVGTDPRTSWIPAKRGLDYCEWVLTLGAKDKSPSYVSLFKALKSYFENKPLTLVHGDCRPGNMIWRGGSAGASKAVMFADWEATNAAPPVWDFCYSTVIGLDKVVREESQSRLLADYHASLVQATEHYGRPTPQPLETFQDDLLLLTIVLFYVSYTVQTGEFWKNQGNTNKDLKSWGDRVVSALLAVDADRAGSLLAKHGAGAEDVKGLQELANNWLKSVQVK